MKVTRIIYCSDLNEGKYEQLSEQTKQLSNIRPFVWHDFGSINGASIKRQICNQWLKEKHQFKILVSAWEETLMVLFDNVKANCESAKVCKVIQKQTTDKKNQSLYTSLKSEQWTCDIYLKRLVRKYWKHVFARLHDLKVDWPSFQRIKSILLKRTERHRLELLNQESSCNPLRLSTKSELPKMSDLVFLGTDFHCVTQLELMD